MFWARHDRPKRVLQIVLRGGHLQAGYYNLGLTYVGADISPEHESVLAEIASSTYTEIEYTADLYRHEVDLSEDDLIEHRLIFSSSMYSGSDEKAWPWFTIRCRELHWQVIPKTSRRLPSMKDRYMSIQ